eukprot:TRINITY_DN1785_c0_g1_i3.p1 TRINITY_DN1785_c0_g1~~TRINITY_DN1785_c0_g1_i3.p1  ORF type:complete len:318 (-),score=75.67 TRINITY_DN1785_c0_g1_i3:7-960(-)
MRIDRDNGDILYNTTIGGTGNDRVTFMNVGGSSSEELVVCGTTNGAIDSSTSSSGLLDIWVAYYRGQTQTRNWIKQVGTASNDYRPICFLDRFTSDVYLVGQTSDSIIPGQTSSQTRWFGMRYDSNGNYQSGRYLTSGGVVPELEDIHVNATKLVICGQSSGSLDGVEVTNGGALIGTALIVDKTLTPGSSGGHPDPTPTPSPTPSPTVSCYSFENCSACTAAYGCGWCASGSEIKCLKGSKAGPSDGECPAVEWKFDLCDDGGAVLAGVVTAVVVIGAVGGGVASTSSSAASGVSGAGGAGAGASGASLSVPQPVA